MANEFELSFQGSQTLYVILRKSENAAVWDGESFVTWNDEDLSDYALPLLDRGGDVYQASFPASEETPIAQGRYRALYYLQAGSSPDTDDLLVATRSFYWNGSSVGDEPQEEPATADEYALTTPANVISFLRLTDLTSSDEALLVMLVNQVSARIERLCARKFKARRWVQRYATTPDGRITLNHYPVQRVHRIATGHSPSLRVRFEPSSALTASVSVLYDDTGKQGFVRLSSAAADGSSSVTSLTFEDYPTTTLLTQAIQAIEGWSATEITSVPSEQLFAVNAADALGQHASLSHPDQLVNWWDMEPSLGRLHLWQRASTVMVDYQAGYENIPDDITLTATELVAQAWQMGRQNPALRSETLGQYSYTLATQSQISDELSTRLRLYMEVR